MGEPSFLWTRWSSRSCSSIALYIFTGAFTSPNAMLPDQIARGMWFLVTRQGVLEKRSALLQAFEPFRCSGDGPCGLVASALRRREGSPGSLESFLRVRELRFQP